MVGVKQFNEDEVIDAVLDVFWRKGLRETTMQDLAEAADVQRGSLYNAYGDKETLFLLAFDRYANRFLAAIRNAFASADGADALAAFFKVAITNMTSGAPARGCLTTRTALDALVCSDRVRLRLQAWLDDLEQTLTEALSRDAVREALALEPHRAALLVLTFTRGLAVLERAFQDPARLREAAAALVDVLCPHAARKSRTSLRKPTPRRR